MHTEARHMTSVLAGSVNDVFPHKACINLDRELDSWERMKARFAHHDIRAVRRIAAVDGRTVKLPAMWRYSAGEYGCLESHRRAVVEARKLCLPSLLIFEDDVEFDPFFRDKFPVFIQDVPTDWDMIYFGALHRGDPVPVSRNVCRIKQSYSTYAYAMKHTMFDAFIASNEQANAPVDLNNFTLQAQYNCYCFMPHLAWVETRYSDVQQRMADHWYLRESLVIFGEEMDRILGRTLVVIAYENREGSKARQKNVMFLAQFHTEKLRGVKMLVVEQGLRTTLNAASLPGDCRYLLLENGDPFGVKRCFAAGLDCADIDCDSVILSDSSTFVDALNIRANLRMCERFGSATGYRNIVSLSETETERVHRNKFSKGIDLTDCTRSGEQRALSSYGIFRREVLGVPGRRLDDVLSESEIHAGEKGDRQRSTFDSPNDAFRLCE